MSTARRIPATLSGLVASDSEQEESIISMMESTAPSAELKKARGRPKTTAAKPAKSAKVVKARAPARRTRSSLDSKATLVKTKSKRKALADKSNEQDPSDTEEVDDFVHMEDPVSGDELEATDAVPAKKNAHKTKSVKSKEAESNHPSDNVEVEAAPVKASRRGRPAKTVDTKSDSPEKIVMETQLPTTNMDVDQTVETCTAPCARSTKSNSVVRRIGSGSDNERGDVSLRRKLGDITKEHENLKLRYHDLREVGVKEAEQNFEKMQKRFEERTASKLIPGFHSCANL